MKAGAPKSSTPPTTTDQRKRQISSDTLTLVGLGVAAIVVVWLVFSVLKKVIGLLFLAAVVVAGFVLWQNPALLQGLIVWIQNVTN